MAPALVVYESMFGNTRAVAEAIARGLSEEEPCEAVEVGQTSCSLSTVSLLVVGAPTHAFGLSRPRTRQDARTRHSAPLVSSGIGVREWLDCVDLEGTRYAAAFATRASPRVPGSAARAIDRRLGRLGVGRVEPAQDFWTIAVLGPPRDGELARAEAWGRRLARDVAARRAA